MNELAQSSVGGEEEATSSPPLLLYGALPGGQAGSRGCGETAPTCSGWETEGTVRSQAPLNSAGGL